MDRFQMPNDYRPPNTAAEIVRRYQDGERFFEGAALAGADLENARLSGVNLREADLSGANLTGADLSEAVLNGAMLSRVHLRNAGVYNAELIKAEMQGADLYNCRLFYTKLSGSRLCGSSFWCADLDHADLSSTDLTNASLRFADLAWASLENAKMHGTNLIGAQLVNTRLDGAELEGCRVYGMSAWSISLNGAKQKGHIVSNEGESLITVDDIEIAQFIFLLLNNAKLRSVIDTMSSKAVLILGRFTPERKAILDAIREELRRLGYLPLLFDFERPTSKDVTETIMILAGMCLFIIADITNPKSSPLELQATVPNYMTPFVPIIAEGEEPFSMFRDIEGKYDWVLAPLVYDSKSNLVKGLRDAVIKPALQKHDELMAKKLQQSKTRHIGEYL